MTDLETKEIYRIVGIKRPQFISDVVRPISNLDVGLATLLFLRNEFQDLDFHQSESHIGSPINTIITRNLVPITICIDRELDVLEVITNRYTLAQKDIVARIDLNDSSCFDILSLKIKELIFKYYYGDRQI